MLFATERYESFNSVVRQALVHSNRQAPSLDSSRTFANFDHIKHIFSGGFWKDSRFGNWVQVLPAVCSIIEKSGTFRGFLGIHEKAIQHGGMWIGFGTMQN